jgi:hypothetical protein
MAVTIDIPGVGNVEAKNAASEATLREILAAMKANNKALGGLGKGKGGSGTTGAGSGSKDVDSNNAAHKKGAGVVEGFGKRLGIAAEGATRVISSFGNLVSSTANLMSSMSNIGDSVESAASSLNSIPVVGGVLSSVFGAVAGAATKSVGAFQKATSSGATFGGSINQFAKSASAAGMTLTDFAGLIAVNGEAFRLLGGNTSDGAARFATLTKELRSSGATRELNNLGYSTAEVNQGLANYTKSLGQTGRLGGKTNAQLAAGSAKYLKEMDLLAKVTGETRAEQEAARAKLLNDAQFQAKVSSMSTDAGEAFANTVNSLPAGLRDVAKDIMVTGTATTEEAQKFSALMPKSAQMMQKFAAITEAGGTITNEMQQQLQNTMAEEGKAQKANFKTQGMYNKEMAGTYMGIVQASNMQKDALKGAAKAQAEAKVATDDQAYQLEKSKQALAEFSNGMTMALANSGLLSTLMTVFGALASFMTTVVVPIFQMLAPVISQLAKVAVEMLMPALQTVGGIIKQHVVPMFFKMIDFIQDNFVPILTGAGALLVMALGAQAIATWAVVSPLLAAAAPIIALGVGIGLIIAKFQAMGGSISVITDALSVMKQNLEGFFLALKAGFFTLLNKIPGMRGDFDDDLKEISKEQTRIADEKAALETKISEEMKANRDKNAADAKKKEEERDKRDKKYAAAKYGAEKKAIDDKAKAEAPKESLDYSSPEATLKTFAAQQDSPLAKAEPKKDEKAAGTPVAKAETVKAELKPPTATAAGESTKKAMASDSALKQAAAAQDKQEKEKAKTAGAAGAPVQTGAPVETAQSTTDSLLKELNTHMAALLKATRENNRIAEQQLSAQQSMSGDLFTSMGA